MPIGGETTPTGDIQWEFSFEGMPDWAIPLIKVVPIFYTSDQYAERWDELENAEYDFNYIWEKVNNNYKLYIRLSGIIRDPDISPAPLFVNLSLWIINTKYRDSIQHNRGY
jgi:hypothetical protein